MYFSWIYYSDSQSIEQVFETHRFVSREERCEKCVEKARPQGSQGKRDRKAARKYRDSREKENCIVKIEQVYCVEGW